MLQINAERATLENRVTSLQALVNGLSQSSAPSGEEQFELLAAHDELGRARAELGAVDSLWQMVAMQQQQQSSMPSMQPMQPPTLSTLPTLPPLPTLPTLPPLPPPSLSPPHMRASHAARGAGTRVGQGGQGGQHRRNQQQQGGQQRRNQQQTTGPFVDQKLNELIIMRQQMGSTADVVVEDSSSNDPIVFQVLTSAPPGTVIQAPEGMIHIVLTLIMVIERLAGMTFTDLRFWTTGIDLVARRMRGSGIFDSLHAVRLYLALSRIQGSRADGITFYAQRSLCEMMLQPDAVNNPDEHVNACWAILMMCFYASVPGATERATGAAPGSLGRVFGCRPVPENRYENNMAASDVFDREGPYILAHQLPFKKNETTIMSISARMADPSPPIMDILMGCLFSLSHTGVLMQLLAMLSSVLTGTDNEGRAVRSIEETLAEAMIAQHHEGNSSTWVVQGKPVVSGLPVFNSTRGNMAAHIKGSRQLAAGTFGRPVMDTYSAAAFAFAPNAAQPSDQRLTDLFRFFREFPQRLAAGAPTPIDSSFFRV